MEDVLANVRPELVQYGIPFNCAGGRNRNVYLPRVIRLEQGPREAHIVRMLPSQTLADYEVHAETIAEAFGVARVRMAREGYSHERLLRIELLADDPLDQVLPDHPVALTS